MEIAGGVAGLAAVGATRVAYTERTVLGDAESDYRLIRDDFARTSDKVAEWSKTSRVGEVILGGHLETDNLHSVAGNVYNPVSGKKISFEKLSGRDLKSEGPKGGMFALKGIGLVQPDELFLCIEAANRNYNVLRVGNAGQDLYSREPFIALDNNQTLQTYWRNFGRLKNYDYREHLDALLVYNTLVREGIIEEKDFSPRSVVGGSYGGATALQLANLGHVSGFEFDSIISYAGFHDWNLGYTGTRSDWLRRERLYGRWDDQAVLNPQELKILLSTTKTVLAMEPPGKITIVTGTDDDYVSPRHSKSLADSLATAGMERHFFAVKEMSHAPEHLEYLRVQETPQDHPWMSVREQQHLRSVMQHNIHFASALLDMGGLE